MLNKENVRTVSWKSRLQKFAFASGIAFLVVAVFFALPIDFLLAIGVNGVFQSEAVPYNLFEKVQWIEKGMIAAFIGIQSLFGK